MEKLTSPQVHESVRQFLVGESARNRIAGLIVADRDRGEVAWNTAVRITNWLDGELARTLDPPDQGLRVGLCQVSD